MTTTALDPIERLIQLRHSLKDAWVTLDQSNLEFFKTIFGRVEGRNKTVLEVGSGFGLTCILFQLLGAREVHGVELVECAVATANELRDSIDPGLQVFFTQHNAADPLPFPDAKFDALLLIEVISHVVFDDIRRFFREMSRVLKPGGIIYISDGNNSYSPFRRKQNQEIWDRFENGPPTAPGATCHTHIIRKPYVQSRREIAEQTVPALKPEAYEAIARSTFGFNRDAVEQATRRYAECGQLPNSVYTKGVCPIEPVSNQYIEKMFDPFELCGMFTDMGFSVNRLTSRRTLPIQRLWDAVPRVTMLVANGFTIEAQKL